MANRKFETIPQIYVLGCTESSVNHLRLDGANGAVESLTKYEAGTSVPGSTSGSVLTVQAIDMAVVMSRVESNEVGTVLDPPRLR